MRKKTMIKQLRTMIETANLADSDQNRSGLPSECANTSHLFGALAKVLLLLDDEAAIDHWAETGEWPN